MSLVSRSASLAVLLAAMTPHTAVTQRAANRWGLVDSTSEYVLRADRESVRSVARGVRDVWFRRTFSATQSDTSADGVRYQYVQEAWLYRFDCTGRRFSHRERILYAQSGEAVRTTDFTNPAFADMHYTEMKVVVPESGGELLWKAGCSLQLPR